MPMIPIATPDTMLSAIEVCTVSLTSLSLRAPWYLAVNTLQPIASPTKRLTRRLIRDEVEPTAASEFSLPKRPTTMMSAALNKSCRMLEQTKGNAKTSMRLKIGPSIISISCFFCFFSFFNACSCAIYRNLQKTNFRTPIIILSAHQSQ